jgi:hypothetical protein
MEDIILEIFLIHACKAMESLFGMIIRIHKAHLLNLCTKVSLLQTYSMDKVKYNGGTETHMKVNLRTVSIMVKENFTGDQIKNFTIKENSKEEKCMALEFSIIHMVYLKVSSSLGSLRARQSPTSAMVISTQVNFIILR